MMKRILLVLPSALFLAAGICAGELPFRQTYPLNPDKVRLNEQRVANDLTSLPAAWKNAPLLYYAIPPLSDVPRLPDVYPEDGTAAGTLRLIAAKGEFEHASMLVYPRKNADVFTL